MIQWQAPKIYLHRGPVDFRKAINGLSLIVEQTMALSPFDPALFVFCNKRRDKLKVLYWDHTGFCLWQKQLEKDKFKWPRKYQDDVVELTAEQFDWLLRGYDILQMQPHQVLQFGTQNTAVF
ncbi:IS66 family insertion sequence element accessory protein TnpB [Microbulbifer sp. 2205BS26-8]|uniref:IS66 family insertion sequence element accessory protein TnpB n=1 Tax=Microbulbifer sp. 2205BS26-8 TaxID=3064386 RepID=UPI00273EA530|nr:IS66 family insertion sequence element accessory protein TnpB [Microbulbifer sp. 2205BS26-8]MDP5211117.1 IS66 family insertion sequence element accessory protein TnpB [Microbulbifer sp. 2205BS26-8]